MGPLGALMLALAFGSAVAQAAEEGSVPSADRNLFFLRQPAAPDGVTLLPLDAVERWLNTKATVTGDEITLSDYGGESHTALGLRLTIGSKTGFVNRKEIELPAAPRLIEGAVYVPLRVIADAVGVWVEPVDHRVHLRKPDLNWECWLAGPRDPRSLEGKMVALALGPKPTTPARIEDVGLSADTLSGFVVIARPSDKGDQVLRQRLEFARDKTGWHLTKTTDVPPPAPAGDAGG